MYLEIKYKHKDETIKALIKLVLSPVINIVMLSNINMKIISQFNFDFIKFSIKNEPDINPKPKIK